MYKKIKETPVVLKKYSDKLIQDGTITQQEYEVCFRILLPIPLKPYEIL